jgi:hypothetical protein
MKNYQTELNDDIKGQISCRAGVIALSSETSPQTSRKASDSPNSPFKKGDA